MEKTDGRFALMRWWVVLLLTGLWLGLPPNSGETSVRAETSAALKIMPLGDSITSGTDVYPSYRYPLYKDLVAAGYLVDFVGSVHGQWGAMQLAPPPPTCCQDFDWDEEGHSGWRIDDILKGAPDSWPGSLQAWAAAAVPDIVLVHLGTNDLAQGETVDRAVAETGQVIDVLRAANPRVRILLAQIIPARWNGVDVTSIPVFNARLPALAASKIQKNSPILVVDMYTNFFIDTHTVDGVHPNGNGEQKMANRWQTGIDLILKINTWVFLPMVSK